MKLLGIKHTLLATTLCIACTHVPVSAMRNRVSTAVRALGAQIRAVSTTKNALIAAVPLVLGTTVLALRAGYLEHVIIRAAEFWVDHQQCAGLFSGLACKLGFRDWYIHDTAARLYKSIVGYTLWAIPAVACGGPITIWTYKKLFPTPPANQNQE